MLSSNGFGRGALLSALVGAAASTASAEVLQRFALYDHLAGGARPGAYGLRFDTFPDGSGETPVTFTFGADAAGSTVTLDVVRTLSGDLAIRMYGTMSGNTVDNVNGGGTPTDFGTYNINIRYDLVNAEANGWTDIAPEALGSITAADATASGFLPSGLDLSSVSNGTLSFAFLQDGHRLPAGSEDVWVGRGWLDGGGGFGDTGTYDWLFRGAQLNIVPLPAAAWMGMAGAGLIAWRIRRR